MIDSEIDNLKGFMPKHEGIALTKWSEKFSSIGPIMEIGSYCGKSAIYLSKGAILNDQLVYTIDHHFGSEEHQIKEEYFDSEIFDYKNQRVNTLPLLIKNINKIQVKNIVPIVSNSVDIASKWNAKLGMVFIDGGHSFKAANNDYVSWSTKIKKNGALVIHDIFENPDQGGQAPFEIFQKALKNNFEVYERVDTLACLIKN
ncbi:MAG: class I SAM-dependent methyltransferase [Pseudomonadota bacterium]|nr:class I SAM-dependent methyltransferase [Pseudomonadota bacterium]|tara:strand:- start:148 stop:750 length:603 start_codon:yes stop_codon:yes gene_type:complete